jgi:hypothetical protein
MAVVPEPQPIVNALRSAWCRRRARALRDGLDGLVERGGEELDFVAHRQGLSKWIRGEYGTARPSPRVTCARRRGARVRDLRGADLDQRHAAAPPGDGLPPPHRAARDGADGPNAFQAVVEGWLYQVGDEVTAAAGDRRGRPGFADATEQRLEDKLADLSKRNPAFAQVLRAYHRAMHEGDFATAQGLLAWLAGQPHTDRRVLKRPACGQDRRPGLADVSWRGCSSCSGSRATPGLVVVLDEVETIQRMNAQTRRSRSTRSGSSWTCSPTSCPGCTCGDRHARLLRGLQGPQGRSPPLYQRVHVNFSDDPRFDNLRAPQVRLLPFDDGRGCSRSGRVRDLYPAKNPGRGSPTRRTTRSCGRSWTR